MPCCSARRVREINAGVPYPDDLREAADVLNAGRKVTILVGAGALRATDEVVAIAEKLGAGVAKALLGNAVLLTLDRSR